MITEIARNIASETYWFWKTTDELKERRAQIAADLNELFWLKAIPQSPHNVLDVGSGSRAGTVALRKLYPGARIVAIDDGSSHQNDPVYRRRFFSPFVVNFQPMSIENFAIHNANAAGFDFILACRLPICYDQSPTWRETCTRGAEKLVALARMLSASGVLAFGYSLKEYPRGTTVLLDNFSLKKLFTRKTHLSFNDDWLILGGANQEFLMRVKENPQLLLTETGQKPDYPYYFRGGLAQDVWDY